MVTQETAKKPYGYQVSCHLKFGESLYLKIKQTISEDEQESKKKQKNSCIKKSTTTRKRSTLTLICIKQVIFVSFLKQKE